MLRRRAGLPKRLAKKFPELTPDEIAEIVQSFDTMFAFFSVMGPIDDGAINMMYDLMKPYLKRLYYRGAPYTSQSRSIKSGHYLFDGKVHTGNWER